MPALNTPSPALITLHPANNAFPNILAANVPDNNPRNLPLFSFTSFLIVPLIPFISNPDSSSDLPIFVISSIYSFEIINAVAPDPKSFFWIAVGVTAAAAAAAVNTNGIKTLLANGVSTFFVNGKPAVINDLRKFRNPPSWLVIFLAVPFNEVSLFSKDLTTFIISFISLSVRVIPDPLPAIYSLLNLSICWFRNSFPKFLGKSVRFLATLYKICPKIGMLRITTHPDCIILDNWIFENFILADEPFASLKLVHQLITIYVQN